MLQIVHNRAMAGDMTSITVRCSVENKKLFIQAQYALGLTDLQSFMIMAAKERAERVLKEREEAGLPIPAVDLPKKPEVEHGTMASPDKPGLRERSRRNRARSDK